MFNLKVKENNTAIEEKNVAPATISQKELIVNLMLNKNVASDANLKELTIDEAKELIADLMAFSTPKQRAAVSSFVDKGLSFEGDITDYKDCNEFLNNASKMYKEMQEADKKAKKIDYILSLLGDRLSSDVDREKLSTLSEEQLNELIALEKEKKADFFRMSKECDILQFKRDAILAHEREKDSIPYANEPDEVAFVRNLNEEFGSDTEEIMLIINSARDNAEKIGEDIVDYVVYKLKATEYDINTILALASEYNII